MPRAIPADSVPEKRGSGYPAPYAALVAERTKRRLGDAFGLTTFGVNLVTIPPGVQTALRHWHSHEDELVYLLEGELVLVTDAGEQTMRAGDVVGFVAGSPDAHYLVNRGAAPARYLEVGSRVEADVVTYPDDDLAWGDEDGRMIPLHKDGARY
jgi:uncharacterized cupin superfamily protein